MSAMDTGIALESGLTIADQRGADELNNTRRGARPVANDTGADRRTRQCLQDWCHDAIAVRTRKSGAGDQEDKK